LISVSAREGYASTTVDSSTFGLKGYRNTNAAAAAARTSSTASHGKRRREGAPPAEGRSIFKALKSVFMISQSLRHGWMLDRFRTSGP